MPKVLTLDLLESMADDPIVFAMANSEPEITPRRARSIATGHSDYPNQINIVHCFPGILRSALDVRAREVREDMKLAAAKVLAGVIPEESLAGDYIIPSVFDEPVAPAVAKQRERTVHRVNKREQETGISTALLF